MADETYIFLDAYSYLSDAAASTPGTSVSTNTPDKANDYLWNTYWETSDGAPQLKIDLVAAYEVDSLWFQHSTNVNEYRLYHSDDDAVYTAVDVAQVADVAGYTYYDFTGATHRYWRLDITNKDAGNVTITECMLMLHQLTLSATDDSQPSRIDMNVEDRGGASYFLADGTAISYTGSTERGKATLTLSFVQTPEANRNSLKDSYEGPPIRLPLVIYPDTEFPSEIFRVIWQTPMFPLRYTQSFKGAGFSGELKFSEI